MLRPLSLLAILGFLTVTAHADLGSARRLFPPTVGIVEPEELDVEAGVEDSSSLLVLGTSDGPRLWRSFVPIRWDGTQAGLPLPLPDAYSVSRTARNFYFWSRRDYYRLTLDGRLIDARPVPFPVTDMSTAYFGEETILIESSAPRTYAIIDAKGNATQLDLPPGGRFLATLGREYAFGYPHGKDLLVRVINDRGEVVGEHDLIDVLDVFSDGTSWLLAPHSSTEAPYRFADRNFQVYRTEWIKGWSRPIPGGRGYYFPTDSPQSVSTCLVTETSGPSYLPQSINVPAGRDKACGPFELFGNSRNLLAISQPSWSDRPTLHAVQSLAELNSPPPPLEIRGALDRRRAMAATNDAGVTLLVWQEGADSFARIYAARISAWGTPLDAEPLQVADAAIAASVATNGRGFVVGWFGDHAMGVATISADGRMTRGFRTKFNNAGSSYLSTAFDGEHYLFSWADGEGMHVGRLDHDAWALSVAGFHDGETSDLAVGVRPNGRPFIVYYQSERRQHVLQRLTGDLEAEGPPVELPESSSRPATIHAAGQRRLLLTRAGKVLTFDPESSDPAPRLIATPNDASDLRIVCEDECVLMWKRVSSNTIEAARIIDDEAGARLDVSYTLASYDPAYSRVAPIFLRGTPSEPTLLLHTAPDLTDGGQQIFVRTAPHKRHGARP